MEVLGAGVGVEMDVAVVLLDIFVFADLASCGEGVILFVVEGADVLGDGDTLGAVNFEVWIGPEFAGSGCNVLEETLEGALGLWVSQLGAGLGLVFSGSGAGAAASRDREEFLGRSVEKGFPVRVLAQFLWYSFPSTRWRCTR